MRPLVVVVALALSLGCTDETPPIEVTLAVGNSYYTNGDPNVEFIRYEDEPKLLLYSPSPPGSGLFDDGDYEILASWTYLIDGLPEPEYINGIPQYQRVEIESHLRIPDIDFAADYGPEPDVVASVCCSGVKGPVTDDRYSTGGGAHVASGDRADADWVGLSARLWGRVTLDSGEVLEFDHTLTTVTTY